MKFVNREEVLKFPFSDGGYYKDADKVECYKEYLKDLKVYDFDLNKLKNDLIHTICQAYADRVDAVNENFLPGIRDGILMCINQITLYQP